MEVGSTETSISSATKGHTSKSSRWMRRVKNRYSSSLVASKTAILCLIWIGIGLNLDLVIWASSVVFLPSNKKANFSKAFPFTTSCTFLIYPVLGYIGERWTRYYVIMAGVVMSCLTTLALQALMLLKSFNTIDDYNSMVVTGIAIFCLAIYGVGLGLVFANIIQFTGAQIQQGSSEEMASFTRWWVFANSFSHGLSFSIFFFLENIFDDNNDFARIVFVLLFVFSIPYFLIGVCFKRYFVIDPPPTVDPLKLVYRVLKYAWKHKYPEQRSAFTYNDDSSSRLDYCKDRYGGPFTTDQVESVKSFWYVLPVIVTVALSSGLSIDIQISNNDATNGTVSTVYLAGYFLYNVDFPLMLVPLFFQLVLFPVCPNLVPRMLKRLLFGLLLNMFSYIAAVILVYPSISTTDEASYVLLAVEMIGAFGLAIVKITSLEFIFAQGPMFFQGLLIGVWVFSLGDVGFAFVTVDTLTRYCIVTGLLSVLLLAYCFIMYRYKYRLRNELSDINRRQMVEDVYERNLEQQLKDNNNHDFNADYVIYSLTESI